MKRFFVFGAVIAGVVVAISSCANTPAVEEQGVAADAIIEDVPTVQAFLMDPVPEADLQRIANAGLNAPSGMNRQPWHIAVVSNAEQIAAMAEAQKSSMKFPPMPGGAVPPPPGAGMPAGAPAGMPMPPTGKGPKSGLGDSPVVIVISCVPGSEFDAGLACECMNDMANLLGYGTKIVSSVTMLFNGENKDQYYEQFQIPEDQKIVAAILLGKVNTAEYDAVSSATPRNPADQVITYVK